MTFNKYFSMTIKKICLTSILLTVVMCAMSQGTTPGDGDGNGGTLDDGIDPGTGQPPPPGGAVPVDGGLGLLLAAGIGYGAKKAYDYRKNKVKSEK